MFSKQHIFRETTYTVIVDRDDVIVCSKYDTLRFLIDSKDDTEAWKWICGLTDADHSITNAFGRSIPKIEKEFSDGDLYIFCNANKIVEDDADVLKYAIEDEEDFDDAFKSLFAGREHPPTVTAEEAWNACHVWPPSMIWALAALRDLARAWTPVEALSIEAVAQLAMRAQNASNLTGLLNSWHSWLPAISRDSQEGKFAWNMHPINRVMADKIAQLAGISTEVRDDPYAEVEKIANKSPR